MCDVAFSTLQNKQIFLYQRFVSVFKEGQPCHKGKEILESQLSILTEKDIDPLLKIDIDESDVVEATPEFLLIDSNHEDDEDIDI